VSWLKSVTADTVVVHTRDGRSIRGVLVGAYHTEVALAHASLLHFGGEDQLDGDVIVLRDNVSSPGTRQRHVPLRCGIRLYGIKAPLTRRSRRVALIYAVQNFAQLDDIYSSNVLFQNTPGGHALLIKTDFLQSMEHTLTQERERSTAIPHPFN
jgi:hypothetical protein